MQRINSDTNVRMLILSAIFTALTAICSQIAIPLPYVPINLALFAVFMTGALLGTRYGALSIIAFVLLGAAGAPVFAGFKGGISALAGPTGGYIIGYILAALATALLAGKDKGFVRLSAAMLAGLIACYLLGTVWFAVSTGRAFAESLAICVYPFLPGDAVKIALAALMTLRLRSPLGKLAAR